MYGTIAKLRVKEGAIDALWGFVDEQHRPGGAVALYALQMDADPKEVYLVAISESREAYRAYSESPESHERYLEMIEWLEAEPEWHDGAVVMHRQA